MEKTPAADDATTPKRLTRQKEGHVLAGVAGGLGKYFGVDPVIFRVAFVVLAVMGGGGLALYVVGWLLVPEEGHERSLASSALSSSDMSRWARIGIWALIGLAAIVTISSGWWWGPGRWGGPLHIVGHLTAGVVVGGAILAALWLMFRRRRWSLRHWLAASAIAGVLLTVVALGATLAAVAITSDVPWRGGIGDRAWRPSTVADVRPEYHLAIGDLLVDLRAVTPESAPLRVKATVGIGRVLILVPPNIDLGINAHSGIGEVTTFGSSDGGVSVDRARRYGGASAPPRLILDAEAGIGQVDVRPG